MTASPAPMPELPEPRPVYVCLECKVISTAPIDHEDGCTYGEGRFVRYTADQMRAYGEQCRRTPVEAAGEPVAWLARKRVPGAAWNDWFVCSEIEHDAIKAQAMHWGMEHEAMAVYRAAPQPSGPEGDAAALLAYLERQKFHPSASHVAPDYRDGYNRALQVVIKRLQTEISMRRAAIDAAQGAKP